MRVVFSKDRPAQLDLLLRSLERNARFEKTVVIVPRIDDLLTTVFLEHGSLYEFVAECGNFERALLGELFDADSDFVTFLCDDDIYYGRSDWIWDARDDVLCFSLRLGVNTVRQYPTDFGQEWPGVNPWRWRDATGDFAYPGSLDGHVFRVADVLEMLDGREFPNPTALECALVAGCEEMAGRRPLMACYPVSVLVGNPVNRVSEQSNVRFGVRFPVSAEECNRRFLAGERIDLDALDFSGVDGAHSEVRLVWK